MPTPTSPDNEKKNEMLESSKTLAKEEVSSHLLPCPFCGAAAYEFTREIPEAEYYTTSYNVGCSGNGDILRTCQVYRHSIFQYRARELWNTRAPNERAITPTDKSSTPPPQSSSPLQKEILGSTEEDELRNYFSGTYVNHLQSQVQSLTVERDELKKENDSVKKDFWDACHEYGEEVEDLENKIKQLEAGREQTREVLNKSLNALEKADLCKISEPLKWANAISEARVLLDSAISAERKDVP